MDLSTSNVRFSPRSWSVPLQCAIPSYQSPDFSLSDRAFAYCPKVEESLALPTGAELDEIATLYAPVLFFHPLESYTLASIDTVLQNFDGQVKFALNNSVLSDTIDMELLLNAARDYYAAFNGEEYFIQQNLSKEFVAGDGFDLETGKCRASIYYNAFEHDTNTWVFNYWFYYPYSGSTSTSILTTKDDTDTVNWYTAMLRSFGEHQGDWQSMSVAICPFSLNNTSTDTTADDSARDRFLQQEEQDFLFEPIAVSYEQHGFREVLDCTMGQCTLYENTTHPVGFVARNSHATYPVSAVHMIFTQWEANFLLHLSGVFGVDHTNYLHSADNATMDSNLTSFQYFLPNSTNVLRHENPSEIIVNVSDMSTYWRTFPGRFGGTELWDGSNMIHYNFSSEETLTEIPFPTCTNVNGTAPVECPSEDEDQAFYTLLQMAHVAVDTGLANITNSQLGQDLFQGLVSFWSSVTGLGSYGPATKPSFRQWMPGINAPIRNDINASVSSQLYCASLLIGNVTTNLSSGIEKVSIYSNVIGICLTMTFLVIVNLIFILHPKLAAKSVPFLRFDSTTGMVQEPDWEQAWQTFRPCVIYCMFYVVTMIGAALYIVGYVQLLDIAEAAFNTDLSSARTLYVTYFPCFSNSIQKRSADFYPSLIIQSNAVWSGCHCH
jgi:hypothetical protein